MPDFSAKYVDKWDAIRVLKEGEYYFTCKYPVRIMSFLQEATASNETAATLYASVRFKVVVHGTPVSFDAGKYPTTDTSRALYKSSSTGLFEVYKPDGNNR